MPLSNLKSLPQLRVRTKGKGLGYHFIPAPKTYMIDAKGLPYNISQGTNYVTGKGKGSIQTMIDYKPVIYEGPPRLNEMAVKSVRGNSTITKLVATNSTGTRGHSLEGPICGAAPSFFYDYDEIVNLSAAIDFNMSYADRALQKAYAKLNEPDFAASEYILEWSQVFALLKDPLRTLVKQRKLLKRWFDADAWVYSPHSSRYPGQTILSFRTRRELHVGKASKLLVAEAGNRWLQYRYGIAPLAKDISEVFNMFFAGGLPVMPAMRRTKARYTVKSEDVFSEFPAIIDSFPVIFGRRQQKSEFYAAELFWRPDGEVDWAWRLGVHPYQWASVLWNGIPFSFVADWAINVDQWLKSIAMNPYKKLLGNCVTHRISNRNTIQLKKVSQQYYYPTTVIKPSQASIGVLNSEYCRRVINLPAPKRVQFSCDWTKLKNIFTGLALILSPILGKNKRS